MDIQTQITDPKIQTIEILLAGLTTTEITVSPLDRIQILRMISETALSALRQAVPEATRDNASWAQIGDALNMSKQGAWEQYR